MFRSFYRLAQENVVRSALLEEFSYNNIHQVPKIERVIVKQFIPDASQNARAVVATVNDLTIITGQKPIKSRTNKAFSNFRNREIQPMGVSVTLKGNMMYSFLDRLINLALPNTDFQGSFDGHGSYRVRFREQGVFPEISPEAVIGKQRVLDVCITTTAQTQKEAHKLLALMGLPFEDALKKAPL